MNLKKSQISLALVSVFFLMTACQKNNGSSQPQQAKPNPMNMGNGNGQVQAQSQPQDLVSKDKARHESELAKLTVHNTDINRSLGLIKKGKVDDIVSANIQGADNISNGLKVVISIREKDNSISTLNFSTDKKLVAQGNYESLRVVSGGSNVSAETRCLVSCEYILVKLHRDGMGEVPFVFKSSELLQMPGYEQDINLSRILSSSHVVELSYLYTQELDNSVLLLQLASTKAAKAAGATNTQLESLKTEVSGLLGDAYQISGMIIKNGGNKVSAANDQLIASGNKLVSLSQNNAVILTNLRGQIKDQAQIVDIEKDLNAVSASLVKAQSHASLLTQLFSK